MDLINSMRENNQLSERRTKISLVTDLHCIHKVDSMECVVAGPLLLQSESSVQGRKKKKKKKQKPRQIVEVNSPSLLDKENISVKECDMKNGSCSTTVEGNSHDSESAEGSENSQDSDEHSEQKNQSLESTSPKSALRGGYELLGFGPRPKLNVKWAPSVWEPPSSIVSHTVNDNKLKKRYSKRNVKHVHKGKANYEQKQQEKRKPQQTKNRNHVNGEPKRAEKQDGNTIAADEFLFRTGVEDKPLTHGCCEAPENEPVCIMQSGDVDSFKCGKSTYAVSLIGSHFPCNLVYGQAM